MKSFRAIAFLQALGVVVYVAFFALAVQLLSAHHFGPNHPVIATTILLLSFVISALICGSLVFAYPIIIFISDRKKEAIETVAWTIAWLILMALLIGAVALATGF